MSRALSFAFNGRGTALKFGAFGCGVTAPTNDLAASSNQKFVYQVGI
jgi:hypothetical protein